MLILLLKSSYKRVMDIGKVVALLDKYNLKDKAEYECKKQKIEEVPYDMQGHHKVYSDLLQSVYCELKDKRDSRLKKLGLSTIDKTEDSDINNWNREMEDILDAQIILKKTADYDYSHR